MFVFWRFGNMRGSRFDDRIGFLRCHDRLVKLPMIPRNFGIRSIFAVHNPARVVRWWRIESGWEVVVRQLAAGELSLAHTLNNDAGRHVKFQRIGII